MNMKKNWLGFECVFENDNMMTLLLVSQSVTFYLSTIFFISQTIHLVSIEHIKFVLMLNRPKTTLQLYSAHMHSEEESQMRESKKKGVKKNNMMWKTKTTTMMNMKKTTWIREKREKKREK